MLRTLILWAAIGLPCAAFSQKNEPTQFGKVTKSEFQIRDCEFDKDADAEVVSDVAEYIWNFVGGSLQSQLTHRRRIKILKDRGLKYADIGIKFRHFRNEQQISRLTAVTYNLDQQGNVIATHVEKNQQFTKKLDARYSEIRFSFPQAKAGSIIEYKYIVEGGYVKDWYLQEELPVRFGRFTVNFPEMFEIMTRAIVTLPLESKDLSSNRRTVKEMTMRNIPGLRNEAFMTCKEDYLQKVETSLVAYTWDDIRHSLVKTWEEVTGDLLRDEDFGVQLKKDIPRTADLDLQLNTITVPALRMKAIHNYVRKNMKWDGKDNLWAEQGVKTAWKEKSGTSGEINLILINLLKNAGLDVHAVLVSTTDHGLITTFWPDIRQFNKVVAMVTIDGHNYILDGTDKFTPAELIPSNLLYTQGMVLDPKEQFNFRWQDLYDTLSIERNTVFYSAEIGENGDINGKAVVRSSQYAKIKRTPVISSGLTSFAGRFLQNANATINLDSLQISNEEDDSLPLEQKFCFKIPGNAAGEYAYFSTNLFTGLASNPFIADTRFADVFFGAGQNHTIVGNLTIPQGYTLEELPKNLRMTLEDKSLTITRMSSYANNTLSMRIILEYKRPYYQADEYPNLKEFYKKMYSMLDEQFVLHKNSTTSR